MITTLSLYVSWYLLGALAAALLLLRTCSATRRHLRTNRKACLTCGYPSPAAITPATVCSECGRPVRRAPRWAAPAWAATSLTTLAALVAISVAFGSPASGRMLKHMPFSLRLYALTTDSPIAPDLADALLKSLHGVEFARPEFLPTERRAVALLERADRLDLPRRNRLLRLLCGVKRLDERSYALQDLDAKWRISRTGVDDAEASTLVAIRSIAISKADPEDRFWIDGILGSRSRGREVDLPVNILEGTWTKREFWELVARCILRSAREPTLVHVLEYVHHEPDGSRREYIMRQLEFAPHRALGSARICSLLEHAHPSESEIEKSYRLDALEIARRNDRRQSLDK